MDVQKIGLFIKELRNEKGFTQEELAERIGSTNKTISRWENGNYMPPMEMLLELSKLFEISLNELVSGERIPLEDYQTVSDQNLLDMNQQMERKADSIAYTALVVVGVVMEALFFIPYVISRNKAFLLCMQTAFFIVIAAAGVGVFLKWRFGRKRNHLISFICFSIGAVAILASILVNVILLLQG